MTKNEYLDYVCDVCEKTPSKYKKDMKYNYVILEEGNTPVCWEDGYPVIYGSKSEVSADLFEGDTIITEEEYFNKFLTD